MKKLRIPLIDKEMILFIGEEEWDKWQKETRRCGYKGEDIEYPGQGGRAYGSALWVDSFDNINTVYHEVAHFLDACYDYIKAEDEGEFKAHISGYVLSKVHGWIEAYRALTPPTT